MPDDAATESPEFDWPDPDLTYRYYLRTCEMLGVEPVPRSLAGDSTCPAVVGATDTAYL